MVHQKSEIVPRGRVSILPRVRISGGHSLNRPVRYEHHRYLGDKRRQVVYDVDEVQDRTVIDELVASEQVATFGPDTLSEARNRGYRLRRA
jgi:hypothetical protein